MGKFDLYRDYFKNDGENKEISKEDMQSLFEMYPNHKEYILLTLETLKKCNYGYYTILKKVFGPNGDGIGGVRPADYSESETLKNAIKFMDKRIDVVKKLVKEYKIEQETVKIMFNKGYTKNEILTSLIMEGKPLTNELLKGNATQVPSYTAQKKSVPQPEKKNPNATPKNNAKGEKGTKQTDSPKNSNQSNSILTKAEILASLNITEEALLEIIFELDDLHERVFFSYYHGLNRPKLSINKIKDLYPEKTFSEIEKIIIRVQKKLSKIVKEYKIKEMKVLKKNALKHTSYFEYFYDENASDMEKKRITNALRYYLDRSYSKHVKTVIKIFGPTYDKLNMDIELTSEEKKSFNSMIILTGKQLYGSSSNKKEKILTIKLKSNLLGYITKIPSKLSEKNLLIKYVNEYLKFYDSNAMEFLSNYYDLKTLKLHGEIIIDKDCQRFDEIISNIKEYVKKRDALKEYKSSLYDYFISSNLSEKKADKIKKEVLYYASSSPSLGNRIAVKLWGENYDKIDTNVNLTYDEKISLDAFINGISKYISANKKNIGKTKNPTITDYFFDFLVKEDQTPDELHYNIMTCIEYINKTKCKYKENVYKLYGTELGELKVPRNSITKEQKDDLRLFKALLNKQIKYDKTKKNNNNKAVGGITVATDYFFDFLVKEGQTPDELHYNIMTCIEYIKKSVSKGKKTAYELYGSVLGKLRVPRNSITKEQKRDLTSLKSELKKYLKGLKSNKNKRNHMVNIRLGITDNFFDFLDKEDQTLEEFQYKKKICLEYLNNSKGKMIDTLIRIYGRDFGELEIPKEEISQKEKNTICIIKSNLNNKINSVFALKSEFEDYCFHYKVSKDNKLKRKPILNACINQVNHPGKDIAMKLYGTDFSKLNTDYKLSFTEHLLFNEFINEVQLLFKKESNMRIKSKGNNNRKVIKRLGITDYFFDFLVKENQSPEELHYNIMTCLEYINKTKCKYKENVYKLYGTELGELKVPRNSITKEQKRDLTSLKSELKKYLKGLKSNKNKRNHMVNIRLGITDNFFDFLDKEDQTPDELQHNKKICLKYAKKTKCKYKESVYKLYGSDLGELKVPRSSITREQKDDLRFFKNILNKYLKNLKSKNNNAPKKKLNEDNLNMMDIGKNAYLVLQNDLFDLKMIKNNLPVIQDNNYYIDPLIMEYYLEYNNSKTIIELLPISEDTLLDFYLNNLDNLSDINEAMSFIIHSNKEDVIKKLFVTPLFLRVVNDLTDLEREVIYLKLVAVTNPSITDEEISKITKVPIDAIENFVIMTKEDKVNDLNQYIRKIHKKNT